MIPGLEARDRTSFYGFTTYWMIKKASVPQQCRFAEFHAAAISSTVSGRQFLVDINETSFILMKRPVRILSWGKPCTVGIGEENSRERLYGGIKLNSVVGEAGLASR